ncbi:MAG: PAS domain-containing protein [Myxococcaceae bacterium]|nr:PAS domain-containing protein [Myxococcaceae bacterium]
MEVRRERLRQGPRLPASRRPRRPTRCCGPSPRARRTTCPPRTCRAATCSSTRRGLASWGAPWGGLGKDDSELLAPEQTAAVISKDRQVLATGQTLTFEDVEHTPSGARVWLCTKGVLKDTAGQAFGIFTLRRDITRHQRVEEEQALHVERLRLCMEAAQVGTWDWDLEAGRIRWSENIDSILGGVPGGPGDTYEAFLQRVLAEDRTRFAQQVAAALKAPADFEAEFQVYVPTGAPRWMHSKVRVLTQGGKATRMLGTLKDVTRELQMEEESRRAVDFQEQLVGIVSHDIRGPLGAIISWARIMAAGGPAPGWDPDRLGQVLSNLLENALKYSPPDTQVRLAARGEKEHVVLAVHNQGKPIPPELMPHIFEPFRRGPQSSLRTAWGPAPRSCPLPQSPRSPSPHLLGGAVDVSARAPFDSRPCSTPTEAFSGTPQAWC